MKMRNKIISMCSVAAAAVILIAVAAFAVGGIDAQPQPDVLTQPTINKSIIGEDAAPSDIEEAPNSTPTTDEAIAEDEEAVLSEVEEATVYYTKQGSYYHYVEHCSGMMGADSHSISEAEEAGKVSCPICCIENYIVYYNQNGVYYHSIEHCSGMRNADMHSILEAIQAEKEPCPVCSDNLANVYYTKHGAYYHFYSDCSGMENAAEHSLTEAAADKKNLCPNCIERLAALPLPESNSETVSVDGLAENEGFIGW